MKNIIFVGFILITPIVTVIIFEKIAKDYKKFFVIINLIISLIFFYIFSPKPIFIFLGMLFIFLCFYLMENFYEELDRIDKLFLPEVKQLETELKIVSEKEEEVRQKSEIIEEKLVSLKEYYRIIEEINENLDLNKLCSEFYFILKNKFEDSIEHLALIKSRKKDVLEINTFPAVENKNSATDIKNNYLNFVSRREFKNYVSYVIFSNYYEYRMAIKFSENAVKEKVVPQLNFLFEETKLGFERAILFKEVEELSRVDGLTGLYLRRYFIHRLENEFLKVKRYNEEFSILMFDIDFFKKVNDTYGHLVGDNVLKDISNILKTVIGNLGLISRWGGEEFLIFLPYHSITKSCEIAEKIRVSIEKNKFFYNNKEVKVTISCGVSNFPVDSNVLEKLIEISDDRLYKAKKSGRNKIVCD